MSNRTGVLVISHGSRQEKWVRLVDEAVDRIQLPVEQELPIVSSFLEIVEGRLIQDGIDHLLMRGVDQMIVIPLFVSAGSVHIDEIRYALGVTSEPTIETDLQPFRTGNAAIYFGQTLDQHALAASIVHSKIAPLSTEPQREIVVLVGHGSDEAGFHEKWQEGLMQTAQKVQELGGFAYADCAMLLPDQVHTIVEKWQQKHPDYQVIIAPFFISEGYFTATVIPQRMEGLRYLYNGEAMLPSPLISQWMGEQIAERLEKLAKL